MLKKILKSALGHPLARSLDMDAPEAAVCIRRIIQSKPFLWRFYKECYQFISDQIPGDGDGTVLEIGSGSGFLKDMLPGLVTSEILRLDTVDIILDAQKLPLKENSLRAIVMVDVFHHLPDVSSFLRDALRCVRPGGKIVMVEPWLTPWSQWMYRFFHHEPLDINTGEWTFPGQGPLSGANTALPWIVFKRDKRKFEKDFPEWFVEAVILDYPFTYLASGGLSYRSSLPGDFYNLIRRFESILQPAAGILAMFAKITLRRREGPDKTCES